MHVRVITLLIAVAAPSSAIVVGYDPVGSTSFGDPNSADYVVGFNQVVDGVNLNGEVMVNVFYADGGAGTCTGSLLSDGQSILTAAHCLDPVDPNTGQLTSPTLVQIYFDQNSTPAEGNCGWFCGAYQITDPDSFFVDPSWITDDGEAANGDDLAVVRLGSPAPSQDQGYSLYTGPTLTSSDILLMAGLGQSGQGGIDGTDYPAGITGGPPPGYMRQGQNAYIGSCPDVFPGQCSSPYTLIGQFSASSTIPDQVDIGPGDSGGGSFYNGQLVGVHSFVDCDTSNCSILGNSYFGDTYVGGANAVWIESVEVSAPEPASVALVTIGAAVLFFRRRRGCSLAPPA